jgi:hypothetical protein
MSTRKELIAATRLRYRSSTPKEKRTILEEFVGLTRYHRKHAIRTLNQTTPPTTRKPRDRIYGEALKMALVMLWEAGDRLCSKRLKVQLPILIEALERHGKLSLDATVKEKLLQISASSIDRVLSETRKTASQRRKRTNGATSAVRRNIRVRTFNDWGDPPPGFFESDMVEHCGGPKYDGYFVHSLVMTDIASAWTECLPLLTRNQTLIVEAYERVKAVLPMPLLGLDTDNDSAFMNETVVEFCKDSGIELTRSRAYKKNDQAWVEQKNGSIVRRLVGYGRLSGHKALAALTELYAVSRLYVNFFQPSFKLKSKVREGAKVTKTYHMPMTPCDRLLASPLMNDAAKEKLRQQRATLDPGQLLHDIRLIQQRLAELSSRNDLSASEPAQDVEDFLKGLTTAWQAGEVRPTHRKPAAGKRQWRTRVDPFEQVQTLIHQLLESNPSLGAKQIMAELVKAVPDLYGSKSQLRTLQRRIKIWRNEQAKKMIFGETNAEPGGHATKAPSGALVA